MFDGEIFKSHTWIVCAVRGDIRGSTKAKSSFPFVLESGMTADSIGEGKWIK